MLGDYEVLVYQRSVADRPREYVIVGRVARHFRVCQHSGGPALPGLERFDTYNDARAAGLALMNQWEAAGRLGYQGTLAAFAGLLDAENHVAKRG